MLMTYRRERWAFPEGPGSSARLGSADLVLIYILHFEWCRRVCVALLHQHECDVSRDYIQDTDEWHSLGKNFVICRWRSRQVETEAILVFGLIWLDDCILRKKTSKLSQTYLQKQNNLSSFILIVKDERLVFSGDNKCVAFVFRGTF